MKRFAWRLQRVLDIKEKTEQIKRAELMRFTEQIVDARAGLLDQVRVLREMAAEVTAAPPGRRVADQVLFLRSAVVNQKRIDALEQEIRRLEAEQQKKLQELLEVRRSKESLERLREQTRLRYIQEQDKLEQKELDDRAAVAFMRRHRMPETTGDPVR